MFAHPPNRRRRKLYTYNVKERTNNRSSPSFVAPIIVSISLADNREKLFFLGAGYICVSVIKLQGNLKKFSEYGVIIAFAVDYHQC